MNNINITPGGHAYINPDKKIETNKETLEIDPSKARYKTPDSPDKIPADVAKKEPHGDDTTAKVTHLQALIRGWKIRNEIFLPHQLLPFVQTHFIGDTPEVQEDIARLLCIEMNKVSSHPEDYKGKSVKLDEKLDAYLFAKPGEPTHQIRRPFSLCIEMDNEGKSIRLLLVPGKILGEGAYKKVYSAHDVEVPRKLEGDERKTIHSVAVGIKDKGEGMQKGYSIQKEIIEKVKEGKFVVPATPIMPSDDIPKLNISYKDIWYNSDMQKALDCRAIPISNQDSSERVPFTLKDQMKVYCEIAKTLSGMEKEGYVHRDVKNPNLFVKLQEGSPSGYLADFDLAQKMGVSVTRAEYRYWDVLSKSGLVYPTTDAYGLVCSMAEAMSPIHELGIADHPYLVLEESRYQLLSLSSATRFAFEVLFSKDKPELDYLRKMFVISRNATTHKDEIAVLYSPKEIATKINYFMEVFGFMLDAESKSFLQNFEKELLVRSKILDLYREVVSQNLVVHQVIQSQPEVYYGWYAESQKDPQNLYKGTIIKYLYSPTVICDKIEELRKML